MIAPNIWIDPKNNNNYFLNVQYPESQINSIADLRAGDSASTARKLLRPTRLRHW